MSQKLSQLSQGRLFSDEWSTIPDTGTQHGLELTSQPTPERAADTSSPNPSQWSRQQQQLSSEERKHYNRALRDLCRIVKIGSRKLDLAAGEILPETSPGRRFSGRRRDHSDEYATLSDPDITLQVTKSNDDTMNGTNFETEYDLYDHNGDVDVEVDDSFVDERDLSRTHKTAKHRLHQNTSPQRQRRREVYNDEMYDEERKAASSKQSLHFEAVYAELVTISEKLQRQTVALHDREKKVAEKEQVLQEREENLHGNQSTIRQAYKDFSKKWHTLQEEHDKQVKELEAIIRERNKENKRQKESFDTLKQANDGLRNQLDKAQEQNKKLESQAVSLQSRLTNLLRKQELTGRQKDQQTALVKARAESSQVKGQGVGSTSRQGSSSSEAQSQRSRGFKQSSSGLYDALGILLEWVSEVHLRHYSDDPSKPLESIPSPALTHDRCTRILPSLVEVLGQLPSHAAKLHLPCLQFIYWALLHLHSNDKQPVSLSSTFRRLGEELYRPMVVRFASDRDKASSPEKQAEKPRTAIFFKSSNLHIRFLSSLVILKTITQVDYLANVFDVLRCDLKDERAKELYLRYQATPIILSYLMAGTRAIVGCAVDIFLQMSMESIFTQQFLYSCCTDAWFRACSGLLSMSGLEVKVLEKMSIILQKLSKIKSNKTLFDSSGVSSLVLELSRSGGSMMSMTTSTLASGHQENAFLILNLRSILFNLGLVKANSSVGR